MIAGAGERAGGDEEKALGILGLGLVAQDGVLPLGEGSDEAHALAQLRPGVDGVVFEYGYHQSTFLPQVWEDLPDAAEFLATLKQKAGLPPDFWHAEVKLARYTVSKWSEEP